MNILVGEIVRTLSDLCLAFKVTQSTYGRIALAGSKAISYAVVYSRKPGCFQSISCRQSQERKAHPLADDLLVLCHKTPIIYEGCLTIIVIVLTNYKCSP